MQIYQLSGRNVEVTEALREYVETKLERLDRYSSQITDARVTLTVRDVRDADRRNRVEVQMNVPHGVIRAEEHHQDMYAAIDHASDVLERQLRKFKTRMLKARDTDAVDSGPGLGSTPGPDSALLGSDGMGSDEMKTPEIVRQKRFTMRPMTPEDAAVQMEALGHDFFVFANADSGGCAVVYRRKDGNYGLIEPKV